MLFLRLQFLVFGFIFVLQDIASAQYSILLLNGRQKQISKYELRGPDLVYRKPDDKAGKAHKMDRYSVYSVTDSLGKEDLVYNPIDTTEDLSAERMRIFIKGEQYASKNYKAPFGVKAESFAVGFGAGLLTIYGTPIPFLNAAVLQRFTPPVTHGLPDEPAEINSIDFQEGFQYKARKRKIEQSLIWGGIGFGIGFASFAIIFPAAAK